MWKCVCSKNLPSSWHSAAMAKASKKEEKSHADPVFHPSAILSWVKLKHERLQLFLWGPFHNAEFCYDTYLRLFSSRLQILCYITGKNTTGSSFLDWFHCILSLLELWKMNAELWLAVAGARLWSVGIFVEVQCCQLKSKNKCHCEFALWLTSLKHRINKFLVAKL